MFQVHQGLPTQHSCTYLFSFLKVVFQLNILRKICGWVNKMDRHLVLDMVKASVKKVKFG